jgi:hypothetical protein
MRFGGGAAEPQYVQELTSHRSQAPASIPVRSALILYVVSLRIVYGLSQTI